METQKRPKERAPDYPAQSVSQSNEVFAFTQESHHQSENVSNIARLMNPLAQPTTRRILVAKSAQARKKRLRLLDLPQELLDTILEFAYPGAPEGRVVALWSYLRRPGHVATADWIKREPFTHKVNDFLVSKRFFYCAARAYLGSCIAQGACRIMCKGLLISAFARHLTLEGGTCSAFEGFQRLQNLTLQFTTRILLPFPGFEFAGATARFQACLRSHDGIRSQQEMEEGHHHGVSGVLRLRGVPKVKFVWADCQYCSRKVGGNKDSCMANRATFEELVRSRITQPASNHMRYGGTKFRFGLADKPEEITIAEEAEDPLYAGSAVSWCTSKSNCLVTGPGRKRKLATHLAKPVCEDPIDEIVLGTLDLQLDDAMDCEVSKCEEGNSKRQRVGSGDFRARGRRQFRARAAFAQRKATFVKKQL